MAVVIIMTWESMSTDLYQKAREIVDWEGNQPSGAISHVCAHDGSSLRVIDVWDSPEQFQAFVESRLMPVLAGQLGVTTEPKVEVLPVYARYAPNEK